MKTTSKITALLLVFCMVLSAVSCGVAPAAKKGTTALLDKIVSQSGANASANAEPLANLEVDKELTKEEKETVVSTLAPDVDTSTLSDKELTTLVDGLISEMEKEEEKEQKEETSALPEAAVDNVYDENGAMTVPFDVAYPDLVEDGSTPYDEGTLLVKLASDATLSSALKKAGVLSMEKIVPMGKTAWFEATLKENVSAKDALKSLRALDEVLIAEFNYEIKTAALDDYKHFDKDKEEEFKKNGHNKDQWHFHYCGIPDGYEEMDNAGGSSSVIVAVIDSGVDYDHEDLKDNIWVNTGEIPDNKIDDDKNGYVDDYYGVDVVAGKGNGDDDNGHGTHVAGIIAADNNTTGVVGIAYNVKIMPIKAAMHNGTLNQADIAEAIYYAYEMGAEVINMSFGGSACTIAVQDALATAYTRCVLVASAGNNGLPNEAINGWLPLPNYPAALSYVLGVMSVDENGVESSFSNWDAYAFNGVEYELYAPGEEIMSTLPDDRYGILSGTSMAAPVVSSFAAILRSEFSDRDMYPTKFIYGQLASTSEIYADCLNPKEHGLHNIPQVVDLNAALTKLPKPEIGLNDFAIFDSPSLSEKNNGDGVIDAGETIALGLTLRNRWGMSKNTMVTIDTLENGISDPYVTIVNPTVDYGSIGTYSTGDCGKIYTEELFTAWKNPFIIKIAEDCPNDYRMTFHVTIRCGNALDEQDETEYKSSGRVNLTARNGVVLPSIIEKDMILTPENLYIIPNSTVIREGVTVRVLPGTNIQFWSDDANDPYADEYMAYLRVEGAFLVEGTRENPVMIYPSQLMDAYNVEMGSTDTGYISLVWADITNLHGGEASGLRNAIDFVDHCTFRQNYGQYHYYRELSSGKVETRDTAIPSIAHFTLCQNSVFYKQGCIAGGHAYHATLEGNFDRCLFVDSGINYVTDNGFKNCVFLGNNFVDQTAPSLFSTSSMWRYATSVPDENDVKVYYDEENDTTYLRLFTPNVGEDAKRDMDAYAEYVKVRYGGGFLVAETLEELELVKTKLSVSEFYADFRVNEYGFCWSDGNPLQKEYSTLSGNGAFFYLTSTGLYKGVTRYTILEIPGKFLPTDIAFSAYEVDLDLEGIYQISPISTPIQFSADSFLYESKDENVVTVDKNGLVTPVGPGRADVTVYSEDRAVRNYVTFTVKESVPLEGISFKNASADLAIGENLVLPITLTPSDTTKRNVVYTSSDPKVFTVKDGVLFGVGSGSATLTATCEGMSATCEITVYQKAISLEFESLALTFSLSEGIAELPKVIASEGAETILTWRSTDEEVATVENGKLILRKLGSTTLVVRDEKSGLSATCIVLVQSQNNASVKKIESYSSGHAMLLENGDLYIFNCIAIAPILLDQNVKDFSLNGSNDIYTLANDGTIYRREYAAYTSTLHNGGYVQNTSVFTTCFQGKKDVLSLESCSGSQFFVTTTSGNVYAWGTSNTFGQLGLGATGSISEPTLVNLDGVVDVQADGETTYFLTVTGDVYYAGSRDSSYTTTVPKLLEGGVEKILYPYYNCVVCLNEEGNLVRYELSGTVTESELPFDFDFVSYGGCHFTASANWGIGILDGVPYAINAYTNPAKLTRIPGITNAVYAYSDDDTHYIATADGLLFGYGTNSLSNNDFAGVTNETKVTTPVRIPLERVEENVHVLSLTQEGKAFRLTLNKAIVNANPRLYADGLQVTMQSEIQNFNTLHLSRALGFEEGVTYTLVFPVKGIVAEGGVENAEEISLTFTYKAPDALGTPFHESVLDESVERILTPASFVFHYKEWLETYQINSDFHGNAILNHISTDTNVEHWLRPLAQTALGFDIPFGGNWWGTTGERAIELQMIDYRDFATYGLFNYAPYLTEAPEDTFPFIVDLSIYNKAGEKVTTVGNETITVRITFNRDMDTSIPLQVRFGSAYPYGDYEIEGKYVDARTWEGTYTLTTIIENGNQLFTISNGFSATDDLEFYTDRGRFGFVIDTTAAQALIMQGYNTDTGIQLSWTQDDFDTLMGYNVYRSTKEDGLYTRLNTSVIPANQMTFFDGTVEPGVKYYYNFTVVQTDLTESTPSGKISIVSRDTMAPDIYHTPVYLATTGKNLIISATVTDNYNIEYAKVFYRTVGESEWKSIVMQNLNSKFSAIIPAFELSLAGLEYYVVAFDGVAETYKGTAEEPYSVTVQLAVDTNSMGDVDGNGVIEVRDALMLLQAHNDLLNLTAEQFLRADLNGDGELATSEALTILQYVSGKITSIVK